MPPALWSLMPLFTFIAGLACLVAAVTWWMLAARQMKTRSATERRLQMLTQRLLAIESRINELENHGRRSHDEHQDRPELAPPGESNQGRRTRTFRELREEGNARTEPTLIAIPDLGAGEVESEGRAGGGELGELHGEAWTLAAAGVAPEEIARQTGQPIGQIELIVGLYRRLHSSRGSIDHARSH